MQACSHTVADRTHRWSKIPDVRAFDGCSDNKQGQGCVVTAIVAETPVRPEANYPVRALVRVESKCSECITQRSDAGCPSSRMMPGRRRPAWHLGKHLALHGLAHSSSLLDVPELPFSLTSVRNPNRRSQLVDMAKPRLACRVAGREARLVARGSPAGPSIARNGGLPLSPPPTSRYQYRPVAVRSIVSSRPLQSTDHRTHLCRRAR